MQVVFITQHYYPNKGGMAASCDRIIRNLRKKGISVHVAHFTNRKRKFHTETAVQGSYTALPIYPSEAYTLQLASQCLSELAHRKSITHVAAFGGHLPIVLGPIVAKWIEKPFLTFIRGNDFDEAIFSKRRDGLLYALQHSTHVFTVTHEKKDKIERLLGHTQVHFTPNGIETQHWQLSKSQIPKMEALQNCSGNRKRIVIVGQLKVKKGIVEFAHTFAQFPYQEDYEVWMVGDVEEQTKAQIEAEGIRVVFFPFVPKNELILFYHAADIVLIPSFYDGMPNVLLEAGAAKNLIIASNVGGIADVITHEKDGFLFHPLLPGSLLEVLLKVHKLPQVERDAIAHALYEKIETTYTEENEIINYTNILTP